MDANEYRICNVIEEAINNDKRVIYSLKYPKYDSESKIFHEYLGEKMTFTPKCICRVGKKRYLFGYNHKHKDVEAVDTDHIGSIIISPNPRNTHKELCRVILNSADPRDYIPDMKIIYDGEVVFLCKSKYVPELYKRFGAPKDSIKDINHRIRYRLERAQICQESLFWLLSINDEDFYIEGPQEAKSAICGYLQSVVTRL